MRSLLIVVMIIAIVTAGIATCQEVNGGNNINSTTTPEQQRPQLLIKYYHPAGLHFDIEPYVLPEWTSSTSALSNDLLDIAQKIKDQIASAIENRERDDPAYRTLQYPPRLTMAIPFWFDQIRIPRRGQSVGPSRPLNEWIQDITDRIAIMDYIDTARYIQEYAKEELEYASVSNLNTLGALISALNSNTGTGIGTHTSTNATTTTSMTLDGIHLKEVELAVETLCIEPSYISFCGKTKAAMHQEILKADTELRKAHPRSYRGLIVHDYKHYQTLAENSTTTGASSAFVRDSALPPMSLYVWQMEVVTDHTERDRLFKYCEVYGFNKVIVEAEHLVLQRDHTPLVNFVRMGHSRGIRVDLLFAHPEWVKPERHAYVQNIVRWALQFLSNENVVKLTPVQQVVLVNTNGTLSSPDSLSQQEYQGDLGMSAGGGHDVDEDEGLHDESAASGYLKFSIYGVTLGIAATIVIHFMTLQRQ